MIAINGVSGIFWPSWPDDFAWSTRGEIPGMRCIQIKEGAEPKRTSWNDNWLCWQGTVDLGFKWSSRGIIGAMKCTHIKEGEDPHTWSDNYLCLPPESPYTFSWSSDGKIENKSCIAWNEPYDGHWWQDNYLCAPETNPNEFPDPVFPDNFTWSYAGIPEGYSCIRIYEYYGSKSWRDNYLCWEQDTKDPEMEWSSAGLIPNKRCTQIFYSTSRWRSKWTDNYLCVDRSSSLRFLWSNQGEPEDANCIEWKEPDHDKQYSPFRNHFLCVSKPDLPDPAFPNDFKLSRKFIADTHHCLQFNKKGYFCWRHGTKDPEMEWSYNGRISNMKCTEIREPAHGYWRNKYLCVPHSSPLRFSWSYNGPLNDYECMLWNLGRKWSDNYLCIPNCRPTKFVVLDNVDLKPQFDGTEIIGLVTGGACIGSGENTLTLDKLQSVTETTGLEFTKTFEQNWGVGIEIQMGGKTPIFGFIKTVTITGSYGQSYSSSRTELKSFSLESSRGTGAWAGWSAPGAALLFGTTDRYKVDKSDVPIMMDYSCASGETYTENTTMELKATKYSTAHFESLTGTFNESACDADNGLPDCVKKLAMFIGDIEELRDAFDECFADGKGTTD